MKKFKTMEEFREYNRTRSKEYYEKNKDSAEYKQKRRDYQRKRYQEMMAKLKIGVVND